MSYYSISLKTDGFENPSLKIDGFGRTHRTHGDEAPDDILPVHCKDGSADRVYQQNLSQEL